MGDVADGLLRDDKESFGQSSYGHSVAFDFPTRERNGKVLSAAMQPERPLCFDRHTFDAMFAYACGPQVVTTTGKDDIMEACERWVEARGAATTEMQRSRADDDATLTTRWTDAAKATAHRPFSQSTETKSMRAFRNQDQRRRYQRRSVASANMHAVNVGIKTTKNDIIHRTFSHLFRRTGDTVLPYHSVVAGCRDARSTRKTAAWVMDVLDDMVERWVDDFHGWAAGDGAPANCPFGGPGTCRDDANIETHLPFLSKEGMTFLEDVEKATANIAKANFRVAGAGEAKYTPPAHDVEPTSGSVNPKGKPESPPPTGSVNI